MTTVRRTPPRGAPTVTVGVDTVSVDEVRASVVRFGARYLDRVYTAGEQAACAGAPMPQARSLAARFAAKEATLKALHLADLTGPWTDIEIRRTPGGWSEVHLHGEAARRATVATDQLSVSLTHDHDRATAVVVAVTPPAPAGRGRTKIRRARGAPPCPTT